MGQPAAEECSVSHCGPAVGVEAEGLVGSPDVEGKDPGTHVVVHVAPPALAYVRVYSTGRQGEGSRRQRNQNIKQSCNASQLSSWKRPALNLSMPCVVG